MSVWDSGDALGGGCGGVNSEFTDSLAADACLAGHEWPKINQSIKLNTIPGMKHILTTKIGFFPAGHQ